MIHAKIKDHEEQKRLADALKASKSRNWYRRLKIIQLSAAGYTVPQLIKLFDLSKATIHRYIKRYNQGGLDALAPVKQTGRPPKIANWTKEQWDRVNTQSIPEAEYPVSSMDTGTSAPVSEGVSSDTGQYSQCL